MEKVVLRLPPGFRFHPTDEELVVQYLKRKVLSYPLHASFIPELHACCDPWDLPGDSHHERYFFTSTQLKHPNSNRSNRATASGYWKATGLDKQIVSPRSNQIVGMKKTLVFYTGKPPKGCRTDWIMHEYRLHAASSPPNISSQVEKWVLCRIFLKKRGKRSDDEADVVLNNGIAAAPVQLPIFYDFMAKERGRRSLVPANSTSASSGITQVSDDHEESSSCNSSFR